MLKNKTRIIIALLLAASILTNLRSTRAGETQPEDRFAKLDAMRVHYQNYGKGKDAVVFVHGWSCNLNFWKANIPAFVSQTRVIAVDLPGHGQSDAPQITYSMDLFARAIDAVLQDAGVERATLVGHSMGTPVIRQFYRKYPNKTRALVIVDGTLRPFANPEQMKQFLEPLRGPNYKAHAEQMVGMMTEPVKDPKNREEIKTAMLSAPQHVMTGAMDAMMAPSIWEPQDKINKPTLVVMAKNPQRTEEFEKFVRDLIPGVDYQLWDGVSHFLMMDEPGKFNDAMLAFLKKNNLLKN
jgi:pimeloyl-ACP methyl ester carboxylesterase